MAFSFVRPSARDFHLIRERRIVTSFIDNADGETVGPRAGHPTVARDPGAECSPFKRRVGEGNGGRVLAFSAD